MCVHTNIYPVWESNLWAATPKPTAYQLQQTGQIKDIKNVYVYYVMKT